MRRKLVRRLTIFAGIAIILGMFLWQVIEVNRIFPQGEIDKYREGEKATIKTSYEVTVVQSSFLSKKEKDSLDFSSFSSNADDFEELMVKILLKNISSQSREIYPGEFLILESGAFFNSFDLINMEEYSPGINELKPGEETELTLLYTIPKLRFHEAQWSTVRGREYSIVLDLYPRKKLIMLTPSQPEL